MKLEELMNLTEVVLTYLTIDVNNLMEKGIFNSLEENIRLQLRSFYTKLEYLKKGTLRVDSNSLGIVYFKEIYNGIEEYLEKRSFMPLASTIEYREFFKEVLGIKENIDLDDKEQLKTLDTYMEKLLNILVREHNTLYQFSLDNEKIVSSNLVFSDDDLIPMYTSHIVDYAKDLPENLKRYSRPLKVRYELDLVLKRVLRDNLSSRDLVLKYIDGGFDKLCPGDIKDMKRIKRLGK